MSEPAFVTCPDDWIGRTIEMWPDGGLFLDSGMFSHERKARGEAPVKTMKITPATTRTEILKWIERARLLT